MAIALAAGFPSRGAAQADAVAAPARSPAERVADVGFRLAVAGAPRCPRSVPSLGLTFQHLNQFEAADRPAVLQTSRLDLGPAVLAVARGSPAEHAGIRQNDILLAVDDAAVPGEDANRPFDQERARARSDAIDDQVETAAAGRPVVRLLMARGDHRPAFAIAPVASCPSRIHLAHSKQQNAFADGRHVLMTTGLLQKLRTDDELAFVLAHEMAHNILDHAARLRAEGVPRGMTRVLGKHGQVLRATEREADRLGGELVLDAGYDLYAAAAVLKSFDEGLGISFLSAHDSTNKRIRAIRSLIDERRQTGIR